MTSNTHPEVTALAAAIALLDEPQTPAPMKQEVTKALARVDLQAVALARFGDWREHVADLTTKFGGVAFDLSTGKKMDEAKDARRQIRDVRIGADKIAKALKSQLRTISTAVGEEAIAVAAAVKDVEAHVHEQIETEETRRAQAATAERERKAGHEMNLATIRSYVEQAKDRPSHEIAEAIKFVQDHVVVDETWEEFQERGKEALAQTLAEMAALRDAAAEKEQREADAERLRQETEAKAREVEAVSAIQSTAIQAMGKSSDEIQGLLDGLKLKYQDHGSDQVKLALTNTVGMLGMMVATNKQAEALLAAAKPSAEQAAQIVAKAEAIVATAEHHPVRRTPSTSRLYRSTTAAPAEQIADEVTMVAPEQAASTSAFSDMDDDGDIDVLGDVAPQVEVVAAAATAPADGATTDEAEASGSATFSAQEVNARLGLGVPEVLLIGIADTFEVDGVLHVHAADLDQVIDSLIAHLESLKTNA